MNKEQIISKLCHGSRVVKDFVVKQSHRFADYVAEKKIENRNNGCTVIFGMRCTKYMFILMNIFYLAMSLFMIFMGSTSYLAIQSFDDLLWFDVEVLSVIWISSGVLLALISVFGIISAIKESITWSNIYGVLLMITFFLQILTSIAAFCLVATGSTRYHAFNLIDQLMSNYFENSDSAKKMDYIQTTYQCCGSESPSDWDNLAKMNQDYNDEFDMHILSENVTDDVVLTTEPLKFKTPASCCTEKSSYQNNTCDSLYEKGCTLYVVDFISETILIVATVLLAIGVLQILGMVSSFLLAKMLRRAAKYRNVKKFNSQDRNIFDVPTFVDYRPLNNSSDA